MMPTLKEVERDAVPGGSIVLVGLIILGASIAGLANHSADPAIKVPAVVGVLLTAFLYAGLFVVNPNEGKVLQLFGRYIGTVKASGLRWALPMYTKRRISMRVRNFDSEKLKVNDADGNPIEIAAVVVWKVFDSAEALFLVDDYEHFVRVQSEAALRNLASRLPYDSHDEKKISLRGGTAEVSDHLRHEIQDRLTQAGVEVIEARISHLAYAPEIAQAMLQRQQANAIIAARSLIVQGAVGMVENALAMLARDKVVELDEERKANMVSNLLVVLCGERGTQPVINTGTIYR
jgi:regulator of protease activity HflC (stomatin/prohibitin superfamily)